MDAPRSLEERRVHALAQLTTPHADAWVASASLDGVAHLVPLSLAWDGERIVLATEESTVTAQNIIEAGWARLGLGGTRDVVMVDADLEEVVAIEADDDIAERFADQADWDPRDAADGMIFLVLRPDRVQVWREVNEIADRTIMRNGEWLN